MPNQSTIKKVYSIKILSWNNSLSTYIRLATAVFPHIFLKSFIFFIEKYFKTCDLAKFLQEFMKIDIYIKKREIAYVNPIRKSMKFICIYLDTIILGQTKILSETKFNIKS